ncbi:hypothetical protein BGX26_007764 [Mortierella sp. AD094]|nr:hypothetical protein BGX26_007764 [Mortierella sp. AD094]
MAVKMTKSIHCPCNAGDTVQKGQYYTQEDLHQDEIKEASNHHEQAIGDHPINAQERPKERPLSEPSLKRSFNHVQVALQTYYGLYLNIQRVSGERMDLNSCYINLAIVEATDQRWEEKGELKTQAAAFHRMPSYEEIYKTNTKAPIPLEKLFDKRKLRDGREDTPKTILVQGRAGIGKTTLCKKLVHAYQNGLWRDRFDAVLWLPLRQLRNLRLENLEDLFREKYFMVHPDNQSHVVVTSRPSGVDMSILPNFDLELETIGFSTKNVEDYVAKVLPHDEARAVQEFINQTPLVQSIVNIPVQLDVICYSWDSLPSGEDSLPSGEDSLPSGEDSVTVTGLYQTMMRKLVLLILEPGINSVDLFSVDVI